MPFYTLYVRSAVSKWRWFRGLALQVKVRERARGRERRGERGHLRSLEAAEAEAQRAQRPRRAERLRQGGALIHEGDLKHRGMPISSGARYILVAFIEYDTTTSLR